MSQKFYCKYCGTNATSVSNLTLTSCPRHPNGPHKGKHVLYEGSEKSQYTCRYCGTHASSISNLVVPSCPRHPNGNHRGHHEPAL